MGTRWYHVLSMMAGVYLAIWMIRIAVVVVVFCILRFIFGIDAIYAAGGAFVAFWVTEWALDTFPLDMSNNEQDSESYDR